MVLLRFIYKLEQKEIEEALLDLNWRREGRFRTVNLWVLSILGVLVLTAYMKDPGQFFLFLLLLLIILLLLYMAYGAVYSRRRRAGKMAARGGEYRLEITESCVTAGEKNEKIKLSDKKLKFLCSEHVIVIRADRDVFTVPRRIVSEEEFGELKKIAAKHGCGFINIVIRKE